MEKFRSRVAKSAAAAATAARQLSSLDEMAENDAYVQSDSLNVSSNKKIPRPHADDGSTSPSRNNHERVPLAGMDNYFSEKFVDVISKAARQSPKSINEGIGSSSSNSRKSQKKLPAESSIKQPVRAETGGDSDSRTTGTGKLPASSSSKYPMLISSVAALYDPKENTGPKPLRHTDSKSKPQHDSSQVSEKQSRVLLVNERHAHILNQLDYDSDNDSSDDEHLNGEKASGMDIESGGGGGGGGGSGGGSGSGSSSMALHEELERELQNTITFEANNELDATKDPNRFMTMAIELENEREALLHSSTSSNLAGSAQPRVTGGPNALIEKFIADVGQGNAGEQGSKALIAGLSWVRNVASPQLQSLSRQIISKVSDAEKSRTNLSHSNHDKQNNARGPMIGPQHIKSHDEKDLNDDIIVTKSVSFLVGEDLKELERIKSKHSSSQMTILLRTCLKALWHNQRLSFVGATLIFALVAYYYSRKRSVDDVL